MSCQLASDSVLYANGLYRVIYNLAGSFLPCWLAYVIAGLVIVFILVNAVLLGAAVSPGASVAYWAGFRTGLAPIAGAPLECFNP